MNNFSASYEKILTTLQNIEARSNFRNQHRQPRMSDMEVLALSLTAEYMGIDSECQLFRRLPDCLRTRIERSCLQPPSQRLVPPFVRPSQTYGRKHLHGSRLSDCRQYAAGGMQDQPVVLARRSAGRNIMLHPTRDSVLRNRLTIMAISCMSSARWMEWSAVSTSRKLRYMIFIIWKMSRNFIRDCVVGRQRLSECWLPVGSVREPANCIGSAHADEIRTITSRNILYSDAVKKGIETLFSQLCDLFMIRRNYAKSFDGFRTRITAKIMALTTIQLINKRNNRKINNLKIPLA